MNKPKQEQPIVEKKETSVIKTIRMKKKTYNKLVKKAGVKKGAIHRLINKILDENA